MAAPPPPSSADPNSSTGGSSTEKGEPAPPIEPLATPVAEAGGEVAADPALAAPGVIDSSTADTAPLGVPGSLEPASAPGSVSAAEATIVSPPDGPPVAPVTTTAKRPSIASRIGRVIVAGLGSASLGLTRFAEAGLGFLWSYLFASIGAGSAIWFLKHRDHLPELLTNKVPWDPQLEILRYVGGSFAAMVALLSLTLAAVRVRSGRFQFARTTAKLGAWLTLLVAAPFVVGLFVPGIESAHAALTLVFCMVIALVFCVSIYRGLGGPSLFARAQAEVTEGVARPIGERASKWAATVAIALLWAGYGLFFSRLAITNHHGLQTRTTDLGYYDNIFYQSLHGHFLGCSFIKAGYHGSAHFDPILVLLSPLYLVYPHAELLLVLQSVWLGSAVIPIYLIARNWKLGRLTSVVIAACFALHPAVHGANMYEFHSLTLANVAILWVVYLLDTNRLKTFFPIFFLALLVREDISLIMCFVGMSAMMRFADRRRIAGFVAILVSLCYFAMTKMFFMTSKEIFQSGPEAYSYAYYYEALTPNNKGFGGFVVSLFTNPVFVVNHVLDEAKVVYFLTIFVPLLFLPFLAKKGKFMLGYGLFFTMLASRTAVFSTHFQYSTTILPFAFLLVPAAIARIKESGSLRALGYSTERLAPAVVAAMLASTIVVSVKFGGILDNQSFRGGFSRVVRVLDPQEKETYAWIAQMSAAIPKDAAVAATDKLGPHISNRSKAFFYGDTKPVDYVFVDEHELRPERLKVLQTDTQRGALVEVDRKGSYVLLKTSTPKAGPPAPAQTTPTPTPPAPPPGLTPGGAPRPSRGSAGFPTPGSAPVVPLAPQRGPQVDPRAAEDDRDREQ